MGWVLGTVALLVVVAAALEFARDASLARRIGREVDERDENLTGEPD